jgi:carbonic anhydrase
MAAIDELMHNNATYAQSFHFQDLGAPPRLPLAVVTCMDARIDVHRVLGLAPGDAHVIRNAGGAVTEDVIRSLVISQRLLGTKEVLVMHHTGCGMLTFRDDDLKREIECETGLRPPFALEAFWDLEQDVRQSVRRILQSPFIPHRDQVRGSVYDVRTGRMREVAP